MTDAESKSPVGIKIIGIFKIVSAVLLVALGIGIFRQVGGDPEAKVEQIVAALKLDPDNRFIHSAIETVSGVTIRQLYLISAGTFVYALLYAIEGVGLVLHRRWAEYFTVFITGSLIPVEAYEVFHKATWVRVGLLAINVAIVAYLIVQLRRRRPAKS